MDETVHERSREVRKIPCCVLCMLAISFAHALRMNPYRYIDEIQCAAARIVHAMREYDKSRSENFPGHKMIGNGDFDTFHIRRGDFQFKRTRIDANEIYQNVKGYITPSATIFIATDERDKSFFDDLKKHYDVKFLDDFLEELKGVNTNYYGMIGK